MEMTKREVAVHYCPIAGLHCAELRRTHDAANRVMAEALDVDLQLEELRAENRRLRQAVRALLVVVKKGLHRL